MSESPVKRLPKQFDINQAVVGRLGNFVLMIDGKGVNNKK